MAARVELRSINNRDGFDALYPRYRGGRPRTFTLPQRQAITRIALAVPTDLGQPFATWESAQACAGYLVAEGVADDISHESLRQLLREEASASTGETLDALQ